MKQRKDRFDYIKLALALADMKPRSKLYKIIKTEMIIQGHWKNLPRGKSFKKGNDYRRIKQDKQKIK